MRIKSQVGPVLLFRQLCVHVRAFEKRSARKWAANWIIKRRRRRRRATRRDAGDDGDDMEDEYDAVCAYVYGM